MNRIKEYLEQIRLSPGSLWQQIGEREDVQGVLSQGGKVLQVGTSPAAELACNLLKEHPRTEIVIVERDSEVANTARTNFPAETNVRVVQGDIFLVSPEEIGADANLILAENFIHFNDAPAFVHRVKRFAAPGAIVLANTPRFVNIKPRIELAMNKASLGNESIEYQIEPFRAGSWLARGALFTFRS